MAARTGMSKRFFHVCRSLYNTNEAFITKPRRTTYVRTYPTTIVQPDGSTFTVRHHEPRQIITLPLVFEELSQEQKQIVIAKRRPKEKIVKQENYSVSFDPKSYIKFVSDDKMRNKK